MHVDKAMGNLGYERAELDFYPTPAEVTEALVPFLKMHRGAEMAAFPLWEPGCGTGAMSEVLEKNFAPAEILSTDIKNYGYSKHKGGNIDFLAQNCPYHGSIVTNPPFGDDAEKFIRKALALTKFCGGNVAMLLRNEYDSASGRNDLFNNAPFARKVVLTWRPRWIPLSTGAPRHNNAWFIWDWCWEGPPVLSYALRGK